MSTTVAEPATPTTETPAAPPAPSLATWVEDEPAVETPTETKVETPAEVKTEAKTDAATVEPPKPHNRDAAIIQLQQRQTTFEREMKAQNEQTKNELLAAIKGLAKPEPAPQAAKPAEVQKARADLKAKVAELRKAELIDELTPAQLADALEPFIERLDELEGKGANDDAVQELVEKALLKRDALAGEQSAKAKQVEQQRQEQLADYKATILADKAWLTEPKLDEIIKTSESRFKRLYRGVEMNKQTAQERYADIYAEAMDAAEAASKTTSAPPAPPTKTSTPSKSPAGTQTVPTGASSASPTTSGKPEVPLWVDD